MNFLKWSEFLLFIIVCLNLWCATRIILFPTHDYIMMLEIAVPFPKEKDLIGPYLWFNRWDPKRRAKHFIFFNVFLLMLKIWTIIKCSKYDQRRLSSTAFWFETTTLQVVVTFWQCLLSTTAVFILSLTVDTPLCLPAEIIQTTI